MNTKNRYKMAFGENAGTEEFPRGYNEKIRKRHSRDPGTAVAGPNTYH
jgi:hypothetical protein